MGIALMIPDIVLTFDGGQLRPLKSQDVHQGYVAGLNDPEVNRYLDAVKFNVQTEHSVKDFVVANEGSSNSVLWGIWQGTSDKHCGTVRLHGIEHFHKTAHIGVCLFDKNAWGKNLGTKAIAAVTQWALQALGLRWIEAGAYLENVASQKAFASAGYVSVFDIPGKYLFEGKPMTVKVYAARSEPE